MSRPDGDHPSRGGFTPGPWRWTDAPGYRSLVQSDHGLIADLLKGGSKRSDEEREANARLIAAAPELFDGLERAFVFICNNLPLGPTNDRTEAGKLIDSLRVPLASARGEQGQ